MSNGFNYLQASDDLFNELENYLVSNEEDQYNAFIIIKDFLCRFQESIEEEIYDMAYSEGYDVGREDGYDEGLFSEGDF